jgi:hypothetical protein
MKKKSILLFALALALLAIPAFAQKKPAQPQPLLRRTTTKTDKFEFGSGGTLAIVGAPNGSIKVVGTNSKEIEITAEIELQAPTEADLARLAEVTTFVTEESALRTGVITIGTHNKMGLKKLPKKFPKALIGLPFRIDYVISVPRYCDLEIDGGKGDLSITGVEGSMRVNFVESRAMIEVVTGSTTATFGSGDVDVVFGVKGWRGRAANIQVASGNLRVRLPANMSAELDAEILRTGAIENTITGLKPRDRKVQFTDKSIAAKAGVGGVPLKFSVGDGTLKMERLVLPL